jgi:uncharacterized protein (TIGR03067 family)
MRTCVVLVAVLALTQAPASEAADEEQTGLEQLRGSWEVVKKSVPDFEAKRLIFDGAKFTVVLDEKEKEEVKFKIDATAKPMRIDILAKKETNLGIYELNGDTLRICFAIKGSKRPTEFKAGEDVILVTLKREKK